MRIRLPFPLVVRLSKDANAAPAWFDRLTMSGEGKVRPDNPPLVLSLSKDANAAPAWVDKLTMSGTGELMRIGELNG